jgi:glycosyltransferase involved in cell wall biosynthesis
VAAAVEFTGAVSSLVSVEHLARASIVVLPSYIEGVPLALIEAMALGRPVVATDVGAIRLHLIRDGRTGLLARPRSISSLRSTLHLAMSDPAQMARIGLEGQRRARPLTIDRMVEATERAYRSTIAEFRS